MTNPTDETNLTDFKDQEEILEEVDTDIIPDMIPEKIQENDQALPVTDVEEEEDEPVMASDNSSDAFDPMQFVQLGDRVVIDSLKYGRTIGTVYYRSQERISIKPDGVSNMLHTFDIHDDENDGESYDEKDGVSAIYIVEKRIVESFVEQQDFRVSQQIDTFDATGNAYFPYEILEVKKETDALVIRRLGEDDSYLLEFNYIGISPDEPFAVISSRPMEKKEAEEDLQEEDLQEEVQNDLQGEDLQEEVQNDLQEDEIQILGEIQITRPTLYVKAESYEQVIPDALQKMDALNDHLSSLTEAQRKNPNTLRTVRMLVELLFELKQSTVSYGADGSVQGAAIVSASTLSELLDSAVLPLGRPVLHVTKTLYHNPDQMDEDHEEVEYNTEQIRMMDFTDEWQRMFAPLQKAISTTGAMGSIQGISKEWYDQQQFLTQYLSPWTPHEKADPVWRAMKDSEFFRNTSPVCRSNMDPCRLADTISGYRRSQNEKEPHPILDEIPFGIERALGITYRKGESRRKQLLLPEESATLQSYILFPMSAVTEMGAIRTHHLAIDSGRSHLSRRTMTTLLETLGEPKDVGTSRDILLFDVTGNTLGNIPLADYVEGLTIPSLGTGDAFSVLQHIGMDQMELHADTLHALDLHISSYQSTLVSTLSTLRTMLSEIPKTIPQSHPFIENPALFDLLRSEYVLVHAMEEYERTHPSLAESDIGKIAYLLKRYPNYVQVAAGKNTMETAKALVSANHESYLEQRRMNDIIRQNEKDAGVRPTKNTCSHVSDLVRIRKEKDDSERFPLLMKFVKRYQGKHDDKWIHCVVCKEHLICIHERLQLHAYLHSKEKRLIEKEILLTCSGGQFQGNYICRICGQAIHELDLETRIEFDDHGRPLQSNAVLVDEDAQLDEKLDLLVSIPIEPSPIKNMNLTDNELPCYHILRDMVEFIGIPVKLETYRQMITMVRDYLYEYEVQEKDTRTPVSDARHLVMAAAVILLLEIQTHIPSYVFRTTLADCPVPESGSPFHGYPLVEDKSNRQGLEYMACAISSMKHNSPVWSRTGFLTMDSKKRRKGTLIFMEQILEKILPDVIIQGRLYDKRQEIVKPLPLDQISSTFLPELLIMSPENVAENVIVPEVVRMTGESGKRALVKLWIRQAHLRARQTALLVRGSVFSETSCCLSPLIQPGEGWKSDAFHGDLPKRVLQPHQQGRMLLTHFIPRPLDSNVVHPDSDLYYRLFLKYCFKGPKLGHAHEPNLLFQCTWCGFQFPSHPSIMNTDTEGKAALASQNIITNTAEFTTLLDTIHRVNRVIPPVYSMGWKGILMKMSQKIRALNVQASQEEIIQTLKAHLQQNDTTMRIRHPMSHNVDHSYQEEWKTILTSTMDQLMANDLRISRSDIISVMETLLIMNDLGAIKPSPLNEWQQVISETTTRMMRLPPDAMRDDIVVAMGPLSDLSVMSETIVGKQCAAFRLHKAIPILKNMAALPWIAFFQVLQSYFIVPLQRMLSGFTKDALFFSYELRQELSSIHINDDLEPLLERERRLQSQLQEEWPESATAKIQYLIRQWSIMVPYSSKIRPMSVPGHERTLEYLQRAILYGPLAMLLFAPLQDAIQSATDTTHEHLARMVAYLLAKYDKERISYNDQELKDKIAVRDEKERVNIIANFNALTDEERAMELINKRLGLGKWSVGGTKLIYAYDKDYYDAEREKRIHAGITDMIGEGYDVEPFGESMEEGYDNNQHGDDDYE